LRELEAKGRELEEARMRLKEEEEEIQRLEKQMASSRERLREYRDILAREEEILRGIAALKEIKGRVKSLDAQVEGLKPVRQKAEELRRMIAREQAGLEKRLEALEEQIKELRQQAGQKGQYEASLSKVRAKLEELTSLQERADSLEEELREAEREKVELEGENRKAKEEMRALKEQIEMLSQAEAHCPLCGQPLSPAKRDELVMELSRRREELASSCQDRKARLAELSEAIKGWKVELEHIRRELRRGDGLRRQEAGLEEALKRAIESQRKLQGLQTRFSQVEQRLAQGNYALKAREGLALLEEKLKLLEQCEEALREARHREEELAVWAQEKVRLENARKNMELEEKRLEELGNSLERRRKFREQEARRVARLAEELKGLGELRNQVQQKADALRELEEEARKAQDRLAAIRQQLNYLARLKGEKEEIEQRLKKVREEKGLYQELREAFGKKGLQAMIIESVLPELEAETNRLLSKMTDGRMHVRFETQKATKRGSVVETLEIKIADELGTRDYRLYSGGESFRVDFAIRVALAKLLARRAGAPLSALFIDEGFGTQDVKGRERVVEAINSIRDEFQFILVVTHIEELKEAFPVRIDVVKTPEGSVVMMD
ncbi:MAG: hypothetical protein DRI61_03790, partial [Chloroflexi bacterium]